MTQNIVSLGLGLISIGREWGVIKDTVPSEEAARELLDGAIQLGIRFFDTAPAYGGSEGRLGRFLAHLDAQTRADVFVATKCGLHWDSEGGADYADHSYDALCRSIDNSLARLERIDLLQLHRATPTAIASGDVKRAFSYAHSLGIRRFGVSVSDVAATKLALCDAMFSYVQLPFNAAQPSMRDAIAFAADAGKQVIVNRPFGMGQLVQGGSSHSATIKTAAFAFVLQEEFSGVVLTGTKSPVHLQQNITAFEQASSSRRVRPNQL